MTGISWGIIPTAGRGTRLAPASDAVPKVLLPVGLRPMIDWAVEEALAAGVENLAFIVSPGQQQVRDHIRKRCESRARRRGVPISIVVQQRPDGIGDALMRCRRLTGDSSFGVVVPDNWFDAERPALAQVAETHRRTGLCSIGLISVKPPQAALLGNVGQVELEALGGVDYRIRRLADKGRGSFQMPGEEPVLRGCARYVVGPELYEALAAEGPPGDGEWDDVPAFQRLAENGLLAGCRLEGWHFDVGQPAGYLAAMDYLFRRDFSDSGAAPR